jgi:hypothetical protein
MLEDYFRGERVLNRLRTNPIFEDIERLADHLSRRGYAVNTAHQYLQAAEHYGNWLGSQSGFSLVIDQRTIKAFITHHLPGCNCRTPATRSLNAVVASLRHLLAAHANSSAA